MLTARFPKGKKELEVSLYQALVLLCFNNRTSSSSGSSGDGGGGSGGSDDVGSGSSDHRWSLSELRASTGAKFVLASTHPFLTQKKRRNKRVLASTLLLTCLYHTSLFYALSFPSGIEDGELRRTLQSLASGIIGTRVLTKEPKGKLSTYDISYQHTHDIYDQHMIYPVVPTLPLTP